MMHRGWYVAILLAWTSGARLLLRPRSEGRGTDTDSVQIDRSRSVQDAVVRDVKHDSATFANVLLPIAHDDNKMAIESHILGFYNAVSTSKELRDASSEVEQMLDDFGIESSMREDVFNLIDAVKNKGEKLDPESQRLLEKDHKSFIRNGLSLPAGEKRDRFKEIKQRLSQISIAFSKNLNEENGGLWFTPEELHGVPEDTLTTLKKGEGENEGKLFLTFKYPDLFPTLKYATNAETRMRVFVENENKCPDNVALFREAILLRDEAARILGYDNHAQFRIEDKMAKTTKTVDDFLGDLRKRLAPGGKKEVDKRT
jgi:metallopeptidase MepB